MQKLLYKDFDFTTTSLDVKLNTDDSCYYVVCDIDYNDICEDKTEQLARILLYRPMNYAIEREEKLEKEQRNNFRPK